MDANSSCSEFEPIEVSLADGRIVDITTKQGTKAFLEGVSNFDYFSSNVKEIRKLRMKDRLNYHDERKLEELFEFMHFLTLNADPDTFRAKIPQSEIQDWLNLIIEEIKRFSKKEIWINTGELNFHDYSVLLFCDPMFRYHVVPVCLAFKSDFFQVLADFIKARNVHGERALPHVAICDAIGRIVYCSLETALHFDNAWPPEKTFKKLEATGILEQVLRCSTVPHPEPVKLESDWYMSEASLRLVLDELQRSTGVITRKFKRGMPCGDTLQAILDGQDGSRSIEPEILNRLKGISALVETMDLTDLKAFRSCKCSNVTCSRIGTSDAPLSRCGGCRFAYYCSKECQKTHWKSHKGLCRELSKPARERSYALGMSTTRFLNQNFEAILEALDKKCESTGAQESDLVVEVDFMPNEDGIIPGFHDPPIFKVALVQDYISGQEIPEWVRRHTSTLTDDDRTFLSKMFETRNKSTSACLFVHQASVMSIQEELIEQYRKQTVEEYFAKIEA